MSQTRTLFIIRHAKSSWDYEGISDIDRLLKLRGIRDAYEMARRIKIEHKLPEMAICSPAVRALHTASIFMQVLELNFSKLTIDERLYGSGLGVIKRLLGEQDENVKKLMIFGHNPDFSDLATALSGNTFVDLPTCGLYKLTFESPSWQDISHKNVKDTHFDFPKKD